MSQLKKGAILSYLTIIITNGIGLLLTPYMIHKLGNSEYGLYTLIGSVIAYISILDFGLNNTIIRFVAKYRAKEDIRSQENFLATTFLIYFFISIIVILLGIVLYYNLDSIFNNLTNSELSKAKLMFSILVFNMAITLPGGAFAAISSAYEHFVFPRALNIIKYITRSILVVVILFYGSDAVGIVVLDTVVNVCVIALNAFNVFKFLKVKVKLHYLEMPLVKEIFSYSIWIFIFAIVGQFQWQSGQIILGIISGTKNVAVYGVGIMLGTYYGSFSTAISGVFLPRATKMTVQEATSVELTSMMIRIGRFSLLVLLLILGGFLLFGQQFVLLWVGNSFTDSWLIALIIMFSYTLPLVQSFANSILEAKSKFSFKALVYISLIVLGTIIGAFLVKYIGIIGLVIGSTGGWLISQIIMNIYYFKILKLEIPRFFKELSNRIVPAFIVILIIGNAINYIPGSGWINLVLKVILFLVLFSFVMFKFGMNKTEKDMIKSVIPNFLKLKSYDS
jgi:O-antigen/teichoic acid export membrane protein